AALAIQVSFFFSSRRRHTRSYGDWSSDVCSSDLDEKDFASEWTASRAGLRDEALRGHAAAIGGHARTQRICWFDAWSAGIDCCRSEERRVGKECRFRVVAQSYGYDATQAHAESPV